MTFEFVGSYDAVLDEVSFFEDDDAAFVVFPGAVLEVPLDQDPVIVDSDSKKKNNRGELLLIVQLVVIIAGALLVIGAGVFYYVVNRQKRRFREEAVHFAAEYDVVRPFLHQRKRIVVEKSRNPDGPPPQRPLQNRLVPEAVMPATPVVVDTRPSDISIMDIDVEHFDEPTTVTIAPISPRPEDGSPADEGFWNQFDYAMIPGKK